MLDCQPHPLYVPDKPVKLQDLLHIPNFLNISWAVKIKCSKTFRIKAPRFKSNTFHFWAQNNIFSVNWTQFIFVWFFESPFSFVLPSVLYYVYSSPLYLTHTHTHTHTHTNTHTHALFLFFFLFILMSKTKMEIH